MLKIIVRLDSLLAKTLLMVTKDLRKALQRIEELEIENESLVESVEVGIEQEKEILDLRRKLSYSKAFISATGLLLAFGESRESIMQGLKDYLETE